MADLLPPAGCAGSPQCLKEWGELSYIPNLGANAFYLTWFAVAAVAQIGLGIKFRTWGYMAAMIGGCALEIVGYVARIGLHDDIFDNNQFIIYLVGLTIGPAFFSAALYLSISRIMVIYGNDLSFLKPRTLTTLFIGCDLISLILQAAGGAIASMADTQADNDMGVNIMIAGLSTQVASTTVFGIICLHLMWAVRKYPHKVNQESVQFRRQFRCRAFFWAIGIATIGILIRCAFRCAELSEGFDGQLANDEVTFMILDGLMMIITVFVLTAAHPGLTLRERWNIGPFWGKKKSDAYAMANTKEGQGSSNSSLDRALV